MIASRPSTFRELLSAYDEATTTLEELERRRDRDEPMILEYRNVCAEIEADIITYCLKSGRDR